MDVNQLRTFTYYWDIADFSFFKYFRHAQPFHTILTWYFVGKKAKGRISKRMFQESKPRQIFRKTNISYSLIRTRTCAYQGVRNVRFSENLACFVFLKHLFWDSPFCLITDDLWVSLLLLWMPTHIQKLNLVSASFLRYCWFIILKDFWHAQPCQTDHKQVIFMNWFAASVYA